MAEHLPSLKRKHNSDHGGAAPATDFFPVGIHVSDDHIAAMGLGKVAIGDEKMLMAVVRVTSISENENPGGPTKSVSLDLIEGITTPKTASEQDKATLLFGK